MFQEELDSGAMTFREVAQSNLEWFETWMHDAYASASKDIPE